MAEVLGRVTSRSLQIPRGPDVVHRVKVPSEWLERGAVIEVEVPRNLRCAACDGGGCDNCDRAGAVTLRGRDELPEIIQVTLPRRGARNPQTSQGVTIRLPEQGGLPRSSAEPVRGFLLLTVVPAATPDPGVRLAESPAPAAALVHTGESAQSALDASLPESGVRVVTRRRRLLVPIAIAIMLLWVGFLLYLRLSGRG